MRRVREALTELGFNPEEFAGHSFRIGAATAAAQAGIEDSVIRAIGRWKSDAFLRYVRTPRDLLQNTHLKSPPKLGKGEDPSS